MNDKAKDALIETIIKHHMDGILLVDQNQQVLFANATASKFLNLTNEALVGSVYPYSLQNNETSEIETPCPDSPNRILECHVTHTENHTPPLYLVTLHDVTQRVRAEEHLRLTSKVFENTAEGIFITDAMSISWLCTIFSRPLTI